MRNAWKIFKQDLANIKRVPLVGILLIGLAILPSLYAWFNLSASWDPYSNTQEVKVAVVNEDAGALINEEFINVGNELEESLAENDNFGWTFTTREDAEKGVEFGDYYASVYIGESFSEELASVVSGEPTPAELHYQVNEKVNAIAPKMTSSGASAIVKEINEQFIAETSKALFQEFDRLGVRLEEELPFFRRMKDRIYDLESRLPEINEVADRMIYIDENWDTVENQVHQFLAIEELIPEVKSGTEQILLLEERMPDIKRMGEGVLELEEKIPELEMAVEELGKINEGFASVAELLEEALKGTEQAQKTIREVQDVLPAAADRAETAEEYMEALSLFIEKGEGAAEPVLDTLAQQMLFIAQTAASADNILGVLDEEETAEKTKAALNDVNEQLESHIELFDSAVEMYTIIYDYSGEEDLKQVISRLEDGKAVVSSLQAQTESVIQQLEAGGMPAEDQIAALREKSVQAEETSLELYHYLTGEGAGRINSAFDGIQTGLNEGTAAFEKSFTRLQSLEELLQHAEEITVQGEENIEKLYERLPEVEAEINERVEYIEQMLPVVTDSVEQAGSFARHTFPAMEARVYTVSDIIRDDLPQVEDEYLKLVNVLEENMPGIEQAVHELADYSRNQIPELERNLISTADAVRDIENDDRLNELILMLRNDLDEESEFFAAPVHLIEEKLFPIPNYGSANAPFYTTLSIWVGALLLSNLISTNLQGKDRRPEYSLRSVYLGRMVLFLIVGLLQGLIVSAGNLLLLGVYAANPVMYVLFSMMIGVIFMTIVYTLASILGNIGKALAIVLLVLQLSGGGGTFPIEVAPAFFQQINPFLPFTYSLNLLREAIGGIIPWVAWKNVLILLGFWILTLAAGLLLKPLLADRIEKTAAKSKSSRLVE
jgi:putative membrane protein